MSTVYNGVGEHFNLIEDSILLSTVKNKYNLPDKYIFFLGNTDPKKNVEGVMRALSHLRRKGQLNFRLLMLDIDRQFLSDMAERIGDKEVLSHISFAGIGNKNSTR